MTDRQKYEVLREELYANPLSSLGEALDRYCEFCELCTALCRKNLQDMDRSWENTQMQRDFLHFATHLEKFEHKAKFLYSALSEMTDMVLDHPRLKLQFLRLFLKVLRYLEAQSGHDLSITEDVESELAFYRRNIEFADKAELEQIRERDVLKSDPVEWTAGWEEVIDEADRLAYSKLTDIPRGMGFCFAFWSARTEALAEFGISWRNPHAMNPRVLFD
ncbi:MAG: hypothetical protein ACI3ZF_04240 [Candidatus Cryptobacteroides sp.]